MAKQPSSDDKPVAATVPHVAPASRYHKGKLTRFGMEQTILEGGSVSHEGRTINNVADLPSEADIAKGDAESEAKAAASLDAQIAALSAQRAKLK